MSQEEKIKRIQKLMNDADLLEKAASNIGINEYPFKHVTIYYITNLDQETQDMVINSIKVLLNQTAETFERSAEMLLEEKND